jgi:hypothetical protein
MIINNWWDADSDELYSMEVRSVAEGFGEYLLAPQRNGTGGESWSYTLVSYVAPGDRVLHWEQATWEPTGARGLVRGCWATRNH